MVTEVKDAPADVTFHAAAPAGLVEQLGLVVEQSMRTAWTQGLEFSEGIRHDKFAYDFRSNVEAGLLRLCDTYKAAVTATEAVNDTGNWHHTEVKFGPIVLTASAVESPQTMVRQAKFRQTLAKNPQLALGLVDTEVDPPSDGLYAVLLYPSATVPVSATDAVPAFVRIRFPMSDLTDWLPEQINALTALHEQRRRDQPSARPEFGKKRDEEAG